MNQSRKPALSRSRRAEAIEDIGSNPSANAAIGDVIAARFSRRALLKGSLAATAIAALPGYAAIGEALIGKAQAQSQAPAHSPPRSTSATLPLARMKISASPRAIRPTC